MRMNRGIWIIKGNYRHGLCFCIFFITLGLGIFSAAAVDSGTPSYTADAVCAFRSIAALDPDPKTRNPDHMAKAFLNPALFDHFPGLGLDYEDAKLASDGMGTGVLYWINARTHHIDTLLHQALEDGFRQVVIMGAGYDSRAYRFHKDYPAVRFFEIDLPATSKDKQARVEKIIGQTPDWVTFVPIDFNSQTLDGVLNKAGFVYDQKTFYIWEGVTYYITKEGVENTLRFVAERSAPGSHIVFDYMLDKVVQGRDYSPHGAKYTVFMIANRGEPFIFGIDPDALEAYVNQFGLSLLSNLGPPDLTRRYLIRSDGSVSGQMAAFMHIGHAQVSKDLQRRQLVQNPNGKDVSQLNHRVSVPDAVKKLFISYARMMKEKKFSALMALHADQYLESGLSREQIPLLLHNVYGMRPIHQFDIVPTHFHCNADKAKVYGYVQRRGYRTPLMINDIIKDKDGQWRLYGNQKR